MGFKWKVLFIKDNVSSNVDTICGWIKTSIVLVIKTVSVKNTFFGTIIKFVIVVGVEVGPTCTAECFKKIIICIFVKENIEWGFILSNRKGKTIYEICGSEKSFISIGKWDGGSGKES